MSKSMLQRHEVDTIDAFLSVYPMRSMQRTERTGGLVNRFSAIYKPVTGGTHEGFIWEPQEYDVRYEVDLAGALPMVTILKGSGNPLADILKVKGELALLQGTAAQRHADFLKKKKGGGGKGKKGYYLEAGVAKAKALKNFQDALKQGIGSSDFVAFCIPRNLKLKHCP